MTVADSRHLTGKPANLDVAAERGRATGSWAVSSNESVGWRRIVRPWDASRPDIEPRQDSRSDCRRGGRHGASGRAPGWHTSWRSSSAPSLLFVLARRARDFSTAALA